MARPCTTSLDDFPIPEDARADDAWPPIMLDMAAHIGPYLTLRIVDAFAGQEVYINRNPERNAFLDIVGADHAKVISHVYGSERLRLPNGERALRKARRAGIVAAIRAGSLSISECCRIKGMPPRRHLSRLINETDEAHDAKPVLLIERPRTNIQLDLFGGEIPAAAPAGTALPCDASANL